MPILFACLFIEAVSCCSENIFFAIKNITFNIGRHETKYFEKQAGSGRKPVLASSCRTDKTNVFEERGSPYTRHNPGALRSLPPSEKRGGFPSFPNPGFGTALPLIMLETAFFQTAI